MSILFLDDMESRHQEWRRVMGLHYPDFLIHQVRTAEEAIRRLESRTFVQVFLDHDLSVDDIMIGPDDEPSVPTGMLVVDHICGMEDPPMDIIVHSLNEGRALEMVRRLRDAHGHRPGFMARYVPFTRLIPILRSIPRAQ